MNSNEALLDWKNPIAKATCSLLLALSVGLAGSSGHTLVANKETVLFRDGTLEAGLIFRHFTGSTGRFYMPEIMGAGCALIDYDRDGDLDVYLIQGTMLDEGKKPAEANFPPTPGWKPGNRLLRNDLIPSGKLRFVDVTEKSGAGHVGYGMGVAAGDYDNDGHPDLYVTNFGPNVLYHNNGNGTFTDVTRTAGVDDARWSTSAAFIDYDRDGDLDLYVANYIDFTIRANRRCFSPTGEPDYCTPAAYHPVPDRLFRNEGKGLFTDVTVDSGVGSAIGPGLGVVTADFNLDGWLDIYVANDGAANLLWMNKGDGTFEESALLSGAAYSENAVPRAGMGVTAADYDNDGDDDILVTNLKSEGATLYRNSGKGFFSDATAEYGLAQPTFPFTGFGVEWFDYDNDGWLDLFISNGAVTIMETLRGSPYPFRQRNLLFHNMGGQRKFREVASIAGPALSLVEVTRGAAFGDLDNDGDLDVLITNNNGPARILLNETGASRHWLEVRLEATGGNRDGLGARVALLRPSGAKLWRRARTDGSYLSANDPRVHFGLGADASIDGIEVHWPNGSKEVWKDVRADRILSLQGGVGPR